MLASLHPIAPNVIMTDCDTLEDIRHDIGNPRNIVLVGDNKPSTAYLIFVVPSLSIAHYA